MDSCFYILYSVEVTTEKTKLAEFSEKLIYQSKILTEPPSKQITFSMTGKLHNKSMFENLIKGARQSVKFGEGVLFEHLISKDLLVHI